MSFPVLLELASRIPLLSVIMIQHNPLDFLCEIVASYGRPSD